MEGIETVDFEDVLIEALTERLIERKKQREQAEEEQKQKEAKREKKCAQTRKTAKERRDAEKKLDRTFSKITKEREIAKKPTMTPSPSKADAAGDGRWTVRNVEPEAIGVLKAAADKSGRSHGDLVSEAIKKLLQAKKTKTANPKSTITPASVKLPSGVHPKVIYAGEMSATIVMTREAAILLGTELLAIAQAENKDGVKYEGDVKLTAHIAQKRVTVLRNRS